MKKEKIKNGYKKVVSIVAIIIAIIVIVGSIIGYIVYGIKQKNDGDELSLREFNSSYELYKGDKSVESVNYLIESIITNNVNSKHLISVTYNDKTTNDEKDILDIKNNLSSDKTYNITLEYDKDGYVNKVIITE